MSEQRKARVAEVTRKILIKLSKQKDTSSGKALLARLRQSIGKPVSETVAVWPILFEDLPEEFLGHDGYTSAEEQAILTTLQLYALHQQSLSHSVFIGEENKYQNIGNSFRQLRQGEDTTAIDRRFNVMITASTFEELVYHLRHLITLLKSKSPETKVDYARLSEDLYWFLRDYQERVRLSWARDYYKRNFKGEKDNDK
ncbi:type I-E CRISPR-associated protein Cse2/CasB [Streptococcus sobrinus]|uniref:CRISPR system CASCADE complex protein CasB n=1 Tax=Streptococcus sobrinus W1703 TaxID=1227275 RepID=U2J758_9STRE|nr:type I-E CRISPR-associated protein Cse2/CasB [Streptococcus sobrinus]AWN61442.1 type I-E CRISPR-associated protein Cse2/CasB [Streptococcus sobrinus]AWN63315.1 type I-E CRISPR-associated protein Cse2/CasB [Streptococcus sobrinus]ERJ75892.1 CRISPR system CASCADE complex protein CasB [Streptococcus sobrinus W1703]SQG19738.1 CRISPR-associated Cse2 family protein [Streptococcus sobrinus]